MCWCGFGETPGDRLPTVINVARENRFSLLATKSAEADDEAVGPAIRQLWSYVRRQCVSSMLGYQQPSDGGSPSPQPPVGKEPPHTWRGRCCLSPEPASSISGTRGPRGARVPMGIRAWLALSRGRWHLHVCEASAQCQGKAEGLV